MIKKTISKIINEEGCMKLLDAVVWRAVQDYVSGLRYFKAHPDVNKGSNYNYCTAVTFLRSFNMGQRILKILENLTAEQIDKLLDKGGLAYSYEYEYYYEKSNDISD
jgi:hypothetical protein